MKLNLDKIEEIYGQSSIYEFYENKENVTTNINYLTSKGFKDVYDIVETYPYIFIIEPEEFKKKVSNLIEHLGVEYIEKLEEDFTLWGEIDD